jgi:MFS family permease
MSRIDTIQRRRTLRFSYFEGSFYAVMVALAESFALFFAVKRGLTPTQVGLISTVPLMLGALGNWLVPQLISDRKLKWGVVGSVVIQIVGVALLVVATRSENHFAWCFAAMSLYWLGQMTAAPLWMDWISGWLPQQRFGRFISRRNSFLAFVTLALFWLGAYWVHSISELSDWGMSFFWLFIVGLLARSVSLVLLCLQDSPPRSTHLRERAEGVSDRWPLWGVIAVVGFAAAFKLVANIASPYFLPYMVNELHFSVFDVSIISGMSFLGLALLMTSYGEAMKSFQPLMGLQVAMFMAAANCFLWLFFSDLLLLSFLQLFAGLYWAGFDLACILILQSQFPTKFRQVLGIHLGLSSLATISGGLVGSKLQDHGTSYLELFAVSAWLRLGLAAAFLFLMFRLRNFKVSWRHYRDFVREAAVPRLTYIEISRILPRGFKRSDRKN